ncbi:MAG: hypothetical protein QOC77_1622, partial [Thermoleophilaceae bacterium]|nr:hypothetical protein [Thermoleophilaceae bacterium]
MAHPVCRLCPDEVTALDGFLICRPSDQLLLGVTWSGLSRIGADASGLPLLQAGDNATLVLTTPPQHVLEQASPAGSAAPASPRPSTPGGALVGVWTAMLSGTSRLAFNLDAGTRLTPSAEGILGLLVNHELRPASDPAGAQDTAVELPWGLAMCPTAREAGHVAVAVHHARPITADGITGLWLTRIVARPRDRGDPGESALNLVGVDRVLAESPDPPWADPPFSVGLNRAARMRVHLETSREPAQAHRLELSSLGGSLSAVGSWPNFGWEHGAVLGRDMHVRTVANGVLFPLGHRAVYTQLTFRFLDPTVGGAAVLRSTMVLTVVDPVRQAPLNQRAKRAFPFDRAVLERSIYAGMKAPVWQDHTFPGSPPLPTYFQPKAVSEDSVPAPDLLFPVRLETGADAVRVAMPLIFVADLSPAFASVSDPTLARELSTLYGQFSASLPGANLDLVRSDAPRDGDRHQVQGLALRGALVDGTYWPEVQTLTLVLPALRLLVGNHSEHIFSYTTNYLDRGDAEHVVLASAEPIDLGFEAHAERSGGLVVPSFNANALSRVHGPVNLQALPDQAGLVDPRHLFSETASLLGFRLLDVLAGQIPHPEILS